MTFHIQAGVPNWLDAVQRLPAGVVVKAFEVQKMAEIKAANPGVKTWHRHWNDPYQSVNTDDTEAIRENRARGWFNQFVDGTFLNGSTAGRNHALATDYISFFNEYYAQSQTVEEKALWWKQERTAARIWRDEYRNGPNGGKLGHIRLTICAAPVGNDIPWQSAETAVLYDCILDYHPYDWWQGGARHSSSWQFQSGRWVTMDATYRNRGYAVRWLFGEGGPYSSAVDGWRHSDVCGGDVTKYVAAVKWWIDQCKATTAYQQGRVLGPPTLFTTGGGDRWNTFETEQPEMNAIADVVRANWNAVPVPPPDPPPPPPPDPEPPPTAAVRSFEGGWTVLTDRLQQPAGFTLQVITPGSPLWYGNMGAATGTVEALHKKCLDHLPAHECANGTKPLILDGSWTYKIQAVGMKSGTALRTVFTGSGRKKITVPVQVHWQIDSPNEANDVYVALLLNGVEVKRLQHPELKDRTWHFMTGEADGPVTAEMRFQTSYANSRDCFTDKWIDEGVITIPPPGTFEERLWKASVKEQQTNGIVFNPALGLWKQILADGLHAVTHERPFEGVNYQVGEKPDKSERWVYTWTAADGIRRFKWPEDVPPPPPPPPTSPTITDVVDQLATHPTLTYDNRPLSAVTTLTIHHSVSGGGSNPLAEVKSIAQYHVNTRGWPGIGYHFCIGANGAIYQVNRLTTKSFHAGSYNAPGDENYWSAGICLLGNFTDNQPPQAQLDAARSLVAYLKSQLDTVTAVTRHRDMPGAATQCPGNTSPNWIEYVRG